MAKMATRCEPPSAMAATQLRAMCRMGALLALLLVPGPDMLLISAQSVQRGARYGIVFHQSMAPLREKEYFYQWPYMAFGDRFDDVLILGEELTLDGELLANIYNTEWIARIDPATGEVRGWIDISGLLSAEDRAEVQRQGGVANGVAWDAQRKRLLVTDTTAHNVTVCAPNGDPITRFGASTIASRSGLEAQADQP